MRILKKHAADLKKELIERSSEVEASERKWLPSRDKITNSFEKYLLLLVHPEMSVFESPEVDSHSLFGPQDVAMTDVHRPREEKKEDALPDDAGSSAHFL